MSEQQTKTSDLKLKPSDVLAKAADLIEPEGKWTQGHGAKNANGGLEGARSPEATCWCLHGAIMAVCPDFDIERAAATFASDALGMVDITDAYDWNDARNRTQAEVVAALRKASTLARSEGC